MTLDTVRALTRELPGVVEEPSYGTPGFKVRKRLFARIHQKEDALVVRVDLEVREGLLKAEPETFYITDHYRDYPWVLVRPSIGLEALGDLLEQAWRLVAPRKLIDELQSRPARDGSARARPLDP